MDFVPIIEELGIEKLTPEEQKPIFESILRNLTMRVGRRLGEEMSEAEAAELAKLVEHGGDAAALSELERRYPNITQIYQEELDTIKENIKAILPR